MTTREMISKWFDRGVADGARHMLVICDTFDHDDYPVFTKTDFDCLLKCKNPGEMQRVMEVYDLRADKAEQLNERRVFRLPATSQPVPPYKEWCRHPEKCAGLASCPQDPTCAD